MGLLGRVGSRRSTVHDLITIGKGSGVWARWAGREDAPLGVRAEAWVDRCSVWPQMCPLFGRMCSVLAPRYSVREGEGFSSSVVGALTGRRLGGRLEAGGCAVRALRLVRPSERGTDFRHPCWWKVVPAVSKQALIARRPALTCALIRSPAPSAGLGRTDWSSAHGLVQGFPGLRVRFPSPERLAR